MLLNHVWAKPPGMGESKNKVFVFWPVTSAEMERRLRSINRSKATGIDDLPPGLLEDSALIRSSSLRYIIDLFLSTGIYSAQWKRAKIVPLYKLGSKTKFGNY